MLVNKNDTSDFNVNKICLIEYVNANGEVNVSMIYGVGDKAGSTSVLARSCCAAT